jgi:glycosyltransferase involved in cell wall biosynthesis
MGSRRTPTKPAEVLRAAVVLSKAPLIAQHARELDVQHLHAHYATHPALAAWAVRRLTGLPFSVTAHAHDLFVEAPMREEKLRAADFVVTVSHFNAEHIRRVFGADIAAKTYVVRCGVDVSRYQRSARTREPVAGTVRILSVGSLQEYKGQRYLVRACALLMDQGIDVLCDIVGEGVLRPSCSGRSTT